MVASCLVTEGHLGDVNVLNFLHAFTMYTESYVSVILFQDHASSG
jgi:hypothetical protein